MKRKTKPLLLSLATAAVMAAAAGATAGGAGAALCAYPISTIQSGSAATATFSVAAGCTVQVSLVAISYGSSGPVLAGSATGWFTAGTQSLTVSLPCGAGETDLVLGPPALFPPAQSDLSATPFRNACTSSPPSPPPKTKVKCNAGRGNGSEGSSLQLKQPGRDRGPGSWPTVDCDPGNSGDHNRGGD